MKVCLHHLGTDNARPLKIDDARVTWPDPLKPSEEADDEDEEVPTTMMEVPALLPEYRVADALVPDEAFPLSERREGQAPDKIIIYLGWPSLYAAWVALLKAHNIKHVEMNGSMTAKKKDAVLQQFKDADVDGPRVLIMSKVGLFGHNISCANILILVVRGIHFLYMISFINLLRL